jgi:hypothetical protein
MSLSTEVILIWSSMLSALKNIVVSSSTSSVSCFGIEEFLVSTSSSLGSNTGTESHVSANNLSTVVVVPEVMRSQWSPFSTTLSPYVTFSSTINGEF